MKSIFIALSLLLSFNTFAKDVEEKKYSEEDFRAKVVEEVEKKMLKLGRNKIIDFSKELLGKENEIRIQNLEIEKSKQELSINQKSFVKKVKEFQGRQTKLLSCLDNMDKEQDKRISHMVDVISGMKADKAANILSVQEAKISVQILGLLDAVKVSKIFNLMDKEISARLQKQYMTMKR